MPLVECPFCQVGFPAEEIDGHKERMHPKEVEMGLQKHGTGEILSEPGDNQRVAKANWTGKDEEALVEENAEADKEE